MRVVLPVVMGTVVILGVLLGLGRLEGFTFSVTFNVLAVVLTSVGVSVLVVREVFPVTGLVVVSRGKVITLIVFGVVMVSSVMTSSKVIASSKMVVSMTSPVVAVVTEGAAVLMTLTVEATLLTNVLASSVVFIETVKIVE